MGKSCEIGQAVELRGKNMAATFKKKETPGSNHPDSMMTPAQIARRKFKSMLPRKIEHRDLSAMRVLGALFSLLEQFRGMVSAEMQQDAGATVYAALAYELPGTAKLAWTIPVPDPGKMVGKFCDAVLNLSAPRFLGVVFVQVDPHAKKTEYKAVSFVVPFMTGADATARLVFAREQELAKIQRVMEEAREQA